MSTSAVEQLANSKFDIKVAKLNLLERVDSQLVFNLNGGLFKATPELMSIINFYYHDQTELMQTIVILDEYNNPISVVLDVIRDLIMQRHQFALNAYQTEYAQLKKVRKGDSL
jgi:ABC-type arginine transport system permease subunit